jgi:MFS family permease
VDGVVTDESGASRRVGAGSANRLIFVGTSIAVVMTSVDATIVTPALPAIGGDLHASLPWAAWSISLYQLGSVVATPIAGRLSDVLGRKRMLLTFGAIFSVASLLCGLAPNIELLLVFRFVQALGGGGLVPSATGVIADHLSERRDQAIGLILSLYSVGALVGPVIGGLIVTHATWRLIFLVNVPLGGLLLALIAISLPRDRRGVAGNIRIDFVGSTMMCAAILGVMLGLNEVVKPGFEGRLGWLLVGLGGLTGIGFFAQQRGTSDPVLPPALLWNRPFPVVNGLNVLYGAAALGIFNLLPLYGQTTYHLTPVEAGALLSVRAIAMAAVSVFTSLYVLRRFGYRRPMLLGFALLAVGLAMLAIAPLGLPPLVWLSLGSVISGAGVGFAGPPANNASLHTVAGHAASITGLRIMFRQTGGIAAISLASALLAAYPAAPVLPMIFVALAGMVVLSSPLIWRVPEASRFGRSPRPEAAVD